MRFVIGYIVWLLIVTVGITSVLKYVKSQDSYIRNRVVQLSSKRGGCSGIQVQAPSGKVYTLTAKHCFSLLENGKVKSTNEQGKSEMISFVAMDDKSDLLLLSAPEHALSIQIADKQYKHQHVHTMTHGAMQPTYRTDGELLSEQSIHAMLFPVLEPEDFQRCLDNKMEVMIDMEQGIVCSMKETVMLSTAFVVAGSSGGPLVNDNGELTGIVSVSDGPFSGTVPLLDIHTFLLDK